MKDRQHSLLGAALTAFVLCLALLPTVAASGVDSLMQIAADTTLTKDHNGQIEVVADNVTLDCADHKVTGSGTGESAGTGISIDSRTGVTVRNCDVSAFWVGIEVRGPNNTFRNNVVARNGMDGIHIASTCESGRCDSSPNPDNNTVDGNTVTDNGRFGIGLGWADNNTIKGNVATGNAEGGISLYDSDSNNVDRNVADDNGTGGGGDGFVLTLSHSNTVTDNEATGNTLNGFGLGDSDHNSFTNNESHRNTKWGFADYSGTGTNTYSENLCIGNLEGGSTPEGLCSESGTITDDGVERLAGSNRFATAAAISASEFASGVPAAYVATGGNFPDALAGGPVAALNGGPILLLSSIPGETAAELTRLHPQKIVILGGTGVVSAVDAAALASFTVGPVERLAGSNRFATAAAISVSEFSPGVPVVYIATGANFPDALAGGPLAAINGGPVLLVNAGSIPAETAGELTRLQPQKIVILGGTGAVSATVETSLDAYTTGPVQRLFGSNRFATAAAISVSQFSPGVDVAYVATGANFPDALAGGPIAGINAGPILLVNRDSIPGATATELARLAPKEIVILGGTGVVSPTVENQLAAFIN